MGNGPGEQGKGRKPAPRPAPPPPGTKGSGRAGSSPGTRAPKGGAPGRRDGAGSTPGATRKAGSKGSGGGQAARRPSATATKAPPGARATSARREAQRQGSRRAPAVRGALSSRGSWAVAVGVFALTVVNLPKAQYTDWAPEAAVALVVGVAGLPLLVARAIGRGGARRTSSEVWAARLAVGFVLAGVVSAALATSPTLATLGLYQHGTGWVFMALLAGWWALGTGFGPTDRHRLETALVAGALVNASLAILQQLFGLSAIGLEGLGGQPDGFLGNPVFLGGLLAGSLVLLAPRFGAEPRRWWLPVALVGLGLGVDGERLPALLALVVVVWLATAAFWAQRRDPSSGRRRSILSLEFAGLTAGAVLLGSGLAKLRGGLGVVAHTASSSSQETFGQRFHAWIAAAHAFAAHPILGSGPGQFRAATSAYFSAADVRADGSVLGTFPDAHNLIVEYATTTGIIGLGLLVAWVVFSVRGRSGPLLGFAAVIGALELAEPLNVVITPLAFIALGGAALHLGTAERTGPDGERPGPKEASGRPPGWIGPAGAVLAGVTAIGALLLVIGDVSFESARAANAATQYSAAVVERLDRQLPDRPVARTGDRARRRQLRPERRTTLGGAHGRPRLGADGRRAGPDQHPALDHPGPVPGCGRGTVGGPGQRPAGPRVPAHLRSGPQRLGPGRGRAPRQRRGRGLVPPLAGRRPHPAHLRQAARRPQAGVHRPPPHRHLQGRPADLPALRPAGRRRAPR